VGKNSYVQHGMNLRQALAAATNLGCDVKKLRRTGEVIVSHPSIPLRVVVNSRRKDCPRQLSAFLRRLQGFETSPSPVPAGRANARQAAAQAVDRARRRGKGRKAQ
jgi:hypothetical protein